MSLFKGKKSKKLFLYLRQVVNPRENISFAKYRHVVNSEASEFTTSRYSRVITVSPRL